MDPQVEYPGPALPRPLVQPAVDDAGVISSELEAEMKRLAWSKGDFRFIPYGAFWADMIYATARVHPGAYTFYAHSPEVHGESAFVIDARRTRLGFDVEGPPVPLFNDAKSFAKIEIDFHGSFVIENRPDLLVRLAYWEAKNDDFRILVGHGRDLISPLFPSSLNYSFGYFGGNIGYRRAQFRYERYFRPSDSCLIELQGSLNQNIMRDFSAVSGVVREPGGWPVVQGRLGFVLGDRDGGIGPATLGVSGHVGETGFDFLTTGPPPLNLPPENDLRVRTWSLNADMRIPITDRLGVKGEFFTGSNLSTFYGGIDQGVSLATRTAIRSTGGWIDLWYDITPRLRTHVGWGIDDPNNNDLLFGRTYNQFIYWNAVFEVTEKLVSGFEVCVWKTNYQDLRAGLIPDADLQPRTPGNSVVLQWSVRYNF
ncbi:MAG: hypothetical protein RBS80_23065 [Thermoguttaceae bacterium]|nr:hypothetical protein [Thermoguttaceae bacterium]